MVLTKNKIVALQEKYQDKISLVLNLVFVLYALTFIVSSGLERLTIYLATVLWLLEGDFKAKFSKLFSQKVIILYFAIIVLFMLSVFMSESIVNGFTQAKYANAYSYIFHKNIVYFMMAVYMSTSIKKEFIQYILYAFLIQAAYMAVYVLIFYFSKYYGTSHTISYILSTHRIFYSIALNVGLVLLVNLLLNTHHKIFKSILVVTGILIAFAILLLGSRAGMLVLVVNAVILLVYLGKKNVNYKYIGSGVLLFGIVLIMSYLTVPQIKSRVDLVVSDIDKVSISHDYHSSLGIRMGLYETSMTLLFSDKYSALCGLGYGDAKLKFKNYLEKNAPHKAFISSEQHVHNQYLQIWINGGLLALFLYLAMYVALVRLQIPHAYKLALYGFVSSFVILGLSDIFYHRGVILGLFAFGVGWFLAMEKSEMVKKEEI